MAMQLRGQIAKKKMSNIRELQGYIINHRPVRKLAKLLVCLAGVSGPSPNQIKLFGFRRHYLTRDETSEIKHNNTPIEKKKLY